MDNSVQNETTKKGKNCLKKLKALKVRDSMDFSMTVDAGDGSSPCFSKSIKSSSEFNIMKTVGVLLLIAGGFSLVCSICSLVKRS